MKKIIALCLIAFLLCFVSGCSSKQADDSQTPDQVSDYENGSEVPRKGGTLRLALAGAGSLNPILAENKYNLGVLKLVYDGLFCRTVNEEVVPVLCSGYTVSADGLHYEFTIKDGVAFHNGDRLTAYDVEKTIYMILSSENLYQPRLSAISECTSQGNQLYITLHYPVVNFTALLDFPVLSDADITDYNSLTYVPNGTGRYKVQSYKKSKELYLSVNKNYFRDFAPYIENITVYLLKDAAAAVSMLENVQIDVLSSDVINLYEYTPKRNLSSAEYTSGRFAFVGVNNQKQALLSAKTRVALSAAINRGEILSANMLSHGKAAEIPVPDGSFWNDGTTSSGKPDIQRVKTMLSEDGWADSNADGVLEKEVYGESVALAPGILVNSENPTRLKIAEQIKNFWNAAGVPAYVVAVSFEEYQSRIAGGNYDVYIGEISLLENYGLSFLLRTNENSLGVSSETFDRLLANLEVSGQEKHKQAQFRELCNVLRAEMPLMGLYFENDVIVFDTRVKGDIEPSGSDMFYSIEKWFISK